MQPPANAARVPGHVLPRFGVILALLRADLRSTVGRPAREEVRAAAEGLRELRRAIAMRRGDQPALTADGIRSLVEEVRR